MREERGTGYNMCTHVRAQALQHEGQGKTLNYSLIEYLTGNTLSSVQAVVACYVTAPRICTLVLFIIHVHVHVLQPHMHTEAIVNLQYMYM